MRQEMNTKKSLDFFLYILNNYAETVNSNCSNESKVTEVLVLSVIAID